MKRDFASKIVREIGLSFPKIGKFAGVHHPIALRIYRSFEARISIEKLPRTGRPKNLTSEVIGLCAGRPKS